MRGAGGIGRVEGVGGVGGEARKTLRNGNYFRKRNKKSLRSQGLEHVTL